MDSLLRFIPVDDPGVQPFYRNFQGMLLARKLGSIQVDHWVLNGRTSTSLGAHPQEEFAVHWCVLDCDGNNLHPLGIRFANQLGGDSRIPDS